MKISVVNTMDSNTCTNMVYTKMFIYLVVTSMSLVSGTDYIQVNQNLVVMPTNIPADSVTIDLSDNQISSVDYINGVLSSLTDFTMNRNQLTEFPDLSNCTGVTTLNLESNFINHISADRLDMLTQLSLLNVKENFLRSFPDVIGPASTLSHINLQDNDLDQIPALEKLGPRLRKLYVGRNNIAQVSRQFLDQVQHLTNFGVANTQLTSFPYMDPSLTAIGSLGLNHNNIAGPPTGWFPKLTRLGRLQMVNTGLQGIPMDICLRGNLDMDFDLDIRNNPLVCDQGMRWLRLAEEAGVQLIPGAVCAEPNSMAGRIWETVTWEDLSYHGMCCNDVYGQVLA